jgi:hypothetical protein
LANNYCDLAAREAPAARGNPDESFHPMGEKFYVSPTGRMVRLPLLGLVSFPSADRECWIVGFAGYYDQP